MLFPMNEKDAAAYLGVSRYRFKQLPIDAVELKNGGKFYARATLDQFVEAVTSRPVEAA